ncbi:MAG: long-chain fatty acid--CoA ligase [Candidatus Aminicenantes bacterium]|nr:long-chain fatty acid--CoA ligase [Candidatus Aminicenantes bacterium]
MSETIPRILLNTLQSYPKPDFILVKKQGAYTPISSREFGERVRHFSLGLKTLGFAPGDKFVILCENRPEWVMADLAAVCAGGITVPIYTTLVPEQVKYIIDDSDAKCVLVSNIDQWRKVDAVKSQLGKVKHFIILDGPAPSGVRLWSDIAAEGRKAEEKDPQRFEREALAVKPDDTATIIYTSGTTGVPKGVILTHSNFCSNVVTSAELLEFSSKDTVLSFLPLSHVLERMVTYAYVYRGCTIGYAESVETVAQNLVEVRPNIMVGVPRVFEKIYSKVIDTVLAGSGLKRKIFFWALRVGREFGRRKLAGQSIPGGLKFRRGLAHKLVFSKIVAKTGGRIRFFVSGGAPLSKDIAEFFYAMGLVIMEGYGLTETSPVISVNTFENLKFGTVGKTIPGVEVRIAPDGEILVRGPNVMKGYYKKEAETRDSFEGPWFKTGDIGRVDEEGFVVITDRKKDLIVTAGGKNIAPQPIENVLKTNPYIASALVIGDRRKFIAALLVPNFEKLEDYARGAGIAFRDRAELVKNPRVVSFMAAEVDRATPMLASYEKVKKVLLLERDFEIEKGEMTPSLKIKRNIVEKTYAAQIDSLYQEDRYDNQI